MSAVAAGLNMTSLQDICNNYILIDVGCNLLNKKFTKDLDSIIQRAKDAGIQKIIIPTSSIKSSKEALRLTRFYPGILYCAAGIHPYEAKSWESGQMMELKEIAKSPECVAVGVCGLDYTKDFSPQDMQRDAFEAQVALACELKKPLLLHQKGAHNELLSILSKFRDTLPDLVFHSFVGSCEEIIDYIQLYDAYIGITGFFCKDNTENGIQKSLETGCLPLNKILVESDAPFFYPNARSSKLPTSVKESLTERSLMFLQRYCTFQRNEPCSLPIVVELIAGIIKKSPEEVALATAFNSLKVFGLS